MEDPFRPQHPQQSFGVPHPQHESTCRIEELTQALRSATSITPNRFAWMSPAELCAKMQGRVGRSSSPLLIVDVREDAEAAGGHVTGAQRCGGDVSAQQLGDLAARWRAGCHVVLYCTRSENRAPRTAARLVERLERAAAPGSSGSSSNGVGSSSDGGGDCGARVSVLEGGFVAFVEHVFRAVQGGEMLSGVVESAPPEALVRGYDPSMWLLRLDTDGPTLIHASEHGARVGAGAEAAEMLVQAEAADELAFLVGQGMSLGPAQAQSMPYIS